MSAVHLFYVKNMPGPLLNTAGGSAAAASLIAGKRVAAETDSSPRAAQQSPLLAGAWSRVFRRRSTRPGGALMASARAAAGRAIKRRVTA